MGKIHLGSYDDYTEEAQQSRYFYGKVSIDKLCSFCEHVIPFEMLPKGGPCPQCGEYAMFLDIEE